MRRSRAFRWAEDAGFALPAQALGDTGAMRFRQIYVADVAMFSLRRWRITKSVPQARREVVGVASSSTRQNGVISASYTPP